MRNPSPIKVLVAVCLCVCFVSSLAFAREPGAGHRNQTKTISQMRNHNRASSLGSRTQSPNESRARLNGSLQGRALNEHRGSQSAQLGRRVKSKNQTRSIGEARGRNSSNAKLAATRGRSQTPRQIFTIAQARAHNSQGASNTKASFAQSRRFHSQSVTERRSNNRAASGTFRTRGRLG